MLEHGAWEKTLVTPSQCPLLHHSFPTSTYEQLGCRRIIVENRCPCSALGTKF